MTLARDRAASHGKSCAMAAAGARAEAGAGGGIASGGATGVGVAADANTPLPEGAVLLAQGAEAVRARILTPRPRWHSLCGTTPVHRAATRGMRYVDHGAADTVLSLTVVPPVPWLQRVYTTTFLGRTAVVKERFRKAYRHPVLDAKLTRSRLLQVRGSVWVCSAAEVPQRLLCGNRRAEPRCELCRLKLLPWLRAGSPCRLRLARACV